MTPFLEQIGNNKIHYISGITEEEILSYIDDEKERRFLSEIFRSFAYRSENSKYPPIILGGYPNKRSCKRKTKRNIKKFHR